MKTTALLVALALITVALPSIACAKPVTSEDLVKAQENAGEWLTYGRDYRNWRYSPLAEITPDNAAKLSPVWAMSTGGQFGGLESTPLFRDGVLYFSADYARVFAVDAKTGNIVWRYDPEYEDGLAAMLCCGPIHRGIALKDDMVLVARLDAKLVALNRTDGKVVWEAKIDEWKNGVTTNSAPLVVKDHVIIGVSGGEYGVRGYLKSFNAKTGALEWQTFTVPAPGEPGSETWPKDDTWKSGGGPTWLTGSYDAETNTLYWGIGNPAPWPAETHVGDNLWTESMLAFDPDTGKMKWGFQYTPNDPWDYDGMATPILVDTKIDGQDRKLAVVSNRNGFFYAIDRSNGQFVYAFPLVEGINWTTGIDPKTGRPKVNEAMKPKVGGRRSRRSSPVSKAGPTGFHPPMTPILAYSSSRSINGAWDLTAWEKTKLIYKPGDFYQGADYQMYRMGETIGRIKAIDVANKKVVWEVKSALPLFSGMLVTKGGVLFTGDLRGRFLAYDAKTGKELWKFQTGSGINASPITYELDGKQYVAILSGLGGDPNFYYSAPKGGMLWVFAIDGKVDEGDFYNAQVIEKMLPKQ